MSRATPLSLTTAKASFAPAGIATSMEAALPNFMDAIRTYNDVTAPTIRLIGLGSSVGLGPEGGLDNTNSTIAHLAAGLIPLVNRLGNKTFTVTNGSVGGTTVNAANLTDYDAAKTTAGGTPSLVLLTFGMNEQTPGQYFRGITLPGVYQQMVSLIEKAQLDGADVIVLTSPHLNTGTYSFADAGPYTYPGSQKPLPANTVVNVPNADDVLVPANYMALRVNEQIRKAAADTGSLLLDAERYWLQAVATYGTAALFTTGQTVHPNLFGFQQSYFRAIDDFITALKTATVRGGNVGGQRSAAPETVIGASQISVGNGGSFTITLPANVAGHLMISGSSGGGWHSTWEGAVTTRTGKSAVSQSATSFAETGNVFASVTGSASAPTVTVTATATGAGGAFAWSFRYITGS